MQHYSVFLSDLAKFDLQNIVTYITEAESRERAKYVERGILSEIKRLERFPNAYSKDEYASTDEQVIRFIIKWHYKILYFVEANTVQVAGIFHTAQNPNKLISYNLS
jgi:plasmid stabilization system protein ParE